MKNLFWTSTQSWAGILVQLIVTILLSRILAPSDFGFYAINLSIIHVLMLFAELGTGQYIIKEARRDHGFLSSSLGLVLLTSVFISIAGVALCGIIALAWPNIGIDVPFFATLAVIIVLFSIKSVSFAALQRNHQHKKTAIAELFGLSAHVITAYAFAVYLQTYWALALGYLAYHLVATLGCVVFHPIRPRFKNLIQKPALEFAKTYIFLRMLDMATRTLDNIILAFSTSTHSIGLYQRATNMRNLGHTFSHSPNQQIYYPKLARAASSGKDMQVTYGKFLTSSLSYAIPVSLFGYCVAPGWTEIVFGPAWGEAAPLIQILALAIPFRAVESSLDVLAKAKGLQKQIVPYRIVFAIFYITAIFLASFYALEMVAYAATTVFVLASVFSMTISARMLETSVRTTFRFVAPYLGLFVGLVLIGHFSMKFLTQHTGAAGAGVIVAPLVIALFFALLVSLRGFNGVNK